MSFRAGDLTPKPIWQHDEVLQLGMTTNIPARTIPPGAASDLLNVELDDAGLPRKRDGYVRNRANASGFQSGLIPVGLAELDAGPFSKQHVMAMAGGGAGGIFSVATPDATHWTENRTKDGESYFPGNDTVKMVQGNELLYIVGNKSANMHILKPDGLLIDGGNSEKSPPHGAVDATWLFQRMWILTDEAIYWSKLVPTEKDLEDEEAFDRTLDRILLSPPFGGRAVAIVPWNNQFLMVMYDRGIQAVSVDNAIPNDSPIAVVEAFIGCSSRESVMTIGNGLYFLDQYGQLRILGQTISGLNEGVVKEPISEIVKKQLPGNMNPRRLNRTFLLLRDTLLYVFFASKSSEYADQCMVLDTARSAWVSRYEFPEGFRAGITSNILGAIPTLYVAGGEMPSYSRFYEGTFTDNDVPIRYEETTRQYDWGTPELDKLPRYIEMEGQGGGGTVMRMYLRTSDNDPFSLVAMHEVIPTGDFPLIELGLPDTQFPLTEPDDFPLTDETTKVTRIHYNLTQPQPGDFPVHTATFSVPEKAFPVYGVGTVIDRGRFVQLRITEEESSGPFSRHSFRLAAFQENPRFDS